MVSTLRQLDPGCLGSGRLDAWSLYDFNIQFLNISDVLQLTYYGSVERAANDCYNSNSLARQQLGLINANFS